MTTHLERRKPEAITTDRSPSDPCGTWTIDPATTTVSFARRTLRLWTITGRRHCLGVIHLDALPPVGDIRFQQPSGLPVLTMALDPGSLETGEADRQRWRTLHSHSLEILPGDAWRVMATLTTHQTLGLVELRLAVDPEHSRGDWLVLRGRGVLDRRAFHQQTGLELRPDDPAGVGSARQTKGIMMSGTRHHRGGERLLVAEQVQKVYRTPVWPAPGSLNDDHRDLGRDRGAPAIEVDGLVKTYGAVRAVDGVSLTVGEGEFFGILGPNGAGKTTLLELIEGLRQPDAGQVRLLGERPWPRNPRLLPRIGVQLQASAFFDKLSAREQLETFGALYGVPAAHAAELLEVVGLTDRADTRDDKLSGGQRQRLSIACALVHDPDVVFLDEPTGALDPQARRNLWDLLGEIQARGKTILYTTHHLDEAEALCDRVAIMDHGRVLAMGRPAELVRGLEAPTRVSLPAAALDLEMARRLPGADGASADLGEVVVTTHRPAALLGALAERDRLDGLAVHTATLEDVFLQLTGREYRA